MEKSSNFGNNSFKRMEYLKSIKLGALYEGIGVGLRQLIWSSLTEVGCKTMVEEWIPFCFVTEPYIANISERKNKLPVKRDRSILSPWHNCLLSKNDIASKKILQYKNSGE